MRAHTCMLTAVNDGLGFPVVHVRQRTENVDADAELGAVIEPVLAHVGPQVATNHVFERDGEWLVHVAKELSTGVRDEGRVRWRREGGSSRAQAQGRGLACANLRSS